MYSGFVEEEGSVSGRAARFMVAHGVIDTCLSHPKSVSVDGPHLTHSRLTHRKTPNVVVRLNYLPRVGLDGIRWLPRVKSAIRYSGWSTPKGKKS